MMNKFKNLQLSAICRDKTDFTLYKIPLHQGLQNQLNESWKIQYDGFCENVDEIEFDPGYSPEVDERFYIRNLNLPQWIANESSTTTSSLDSIATNESKMESIVGFAGFVSLEELGELILFQNFTKSHLIKPGKFLLLKGDTYETLDKPSITLGNQLAAVFLGTSKKLLFKNFRAVNTFLPIEEAYEEASESEIKEVLSHNVFIVEDLDSVIANSNQWFKKRFAMLRDSKVLDHYTVDQIRSGSQQYEVDIVVKDGKIVFPKDKALSKKLLQYLNEERFRGAITNTLFETNSKRKSDL